MSEPIHLASSDYENRKPQKENRETAPLRLRIRSEKREADRFLEIRRPRGFDDLAIDQRDLRDPRDLHPQPVPEPRTFPHEPQQPHYDVRNHPSDQRLIEPEQAVTSVSLRSLGPGSARIEPHQQNLPDSTGGIAKAMSHVRQWLPYAQKVLIPLLEGNVTAAVSNLLKPPTTSIALTPSALLDSNGLERSLAEVTANHRELRGQMIEQSVQLKRVEDHLERVREATDRNTLEQQELIEDLRAANRRIRNIVLAAILLLLCVGGVQIFILYRIEQMPR